MCLSVYVCPYLFVSTYAHIYTLVYILMCLSVYVCPYLFVCSRVHIYTLVSILMCLCMYVCTYVTCSTCNISHLSHVHMLRVHMFMTHTCSYDHKSTSSYVHTCPCTNYIQTRMITGHMTTYTLDHSSTYHVSSYMYPGHPPNNLARA